MRQRDLRADERTRSEVVVADRARGAGGKLVVIVAAFHDEWEEMGPD